ncbi:hypothetical protein Mal52_13800 [Symmachiella dynata]|uniref:Uncharacterized protein n=2 Tax=Symmachiella dynata TaxID=2527995 RepID=A0A517ZKA6_9PLAN|nr:hypothetical protein Mal52_13800 [Symmachiella dynata]
MLGYTTKGLRKIIDRSRAKANGAHTSGPTIRFFQTSKGAPIKFKSEWIEEFVERHTIEPEAAPSIRKKQHKKEKQVPAYGLDPQFFDV